MNTVMRAPVFRVLFRRKVGARLLGRNSLTIWVLLVSVLLGTTSCTPIRPYACNYPDLENRQSEFGSVDLDDILEAKQHCHEAFEENSYSLGFIEFDDIGGFWFRSQLNHVLESLHEASKKKAQIVVVFVHGWNHNADADDGNVKDFRSALQKIAEMERARNPESPRNVVGLYLGWRGLAFKEWPGSFAYNWITYWKRRSVAHRVGASGAVTEAIVRVEQLLRESDVGRGNFNQTKGSQKSVLISVGHSLGGAVLADATTPLLISRQASGGGCGAHLGDLVVLVNPAFEASRIDILKDGWQECNRSDVPPSVVIFTATTDSITRKLLPVGENVGFFWERHRPSRRRVWRNIDIRGQEQARKSKIAVGHYSKYVTHCLRGQEQSNAECSKRLVDESKDWDHERLVPGSNRAFVLVQQRETVTPLWLVSVISDDVMEGHNNIFKEPLYEVVWDMLDAGFRDDFEQ